jgi:CBS domain-containing protein
VGQKRADQRSSPGELRGFMKQLLGDLSALETMLNEGLIESGVRRIGAEQELVLVQGAYRPAPVNLQVLEELNDPHYTTELARFNVEVNLDPLALGGDCFRRLHEDLEQHVERVRVAAAKFEAEVVLTGILPTLRLQDLTIDSMTPNPRYHALNEALNHLRGGAYEIRIHGTDELLIKHDTVMLESANTSFQVHLQVDPDEFAPLYNIAQAVTAPLLAAATNSPILFGRRLWRETRIAVFQQAIDTRTSSYYLQDHSSRVHFGRRWVENSVIELFQEDVTRFRALLSMEDGSEVPPASMELLRQGTLPPLKALQLHNSTVYRWNRACYGTGGGKAHLRIENRVLPSGPTPIDEVANAAFWIGMVRGLRGKVGDITRYMEFDDARSNFVAAARQGLGAQFTWLQGEMIPAPELILEHLLPIAREGLDSCGVDAADSDRFLGIIAERVRTRQTGSQWMIKSLARMQGRGTPSQQLCALTAACIARQDDKKPVHEWSVARLTAGATSWKQAYMRVEQIMTTDVITVNHEEVVDLVVRIMDWHNIRYVPVLDDASHLVGLVSHRALLRFVSRDRERFEKGSVPVREIMHREDVISVEPDTLTLDALKTMRDQRIGCLPVTKDGQLVGMLTERNFMVIAGQLLENKLREAGMHVAGADLDRS